MNVMTKVNVKHAMLIAVAACAIAGCGGADTPQPSPEAAKGADTPQPSPEAAKGKVVTTPEPTAVTDAYAMIKVISKDNQPRRVSLLVNQSRNPGEAGLVYERIAAVARKFLNVRLLDAGYVLIDPEVSNAVRNRTPFVIGAPRSSASHCVTQLAMRLAEGVNVPNPSGGFFNRMNRWLFKG